jgi:23S rRNA (cytidine1920-2'-O)/16S rRNA (cytidine1409-2'-O)-methyltransferase
LVLLVKPQFEAGRRDVSRGRGVIRDPDIWRDALAGVIDSAAAAGAAKMDVMASPIHGADGNTEFLVELRRGAVAPVDSDARLDAVIASSAAGIGA